MKTVLAIVTGVVSALVVVFLAVAVILPSQGKETTAGTDSVATAQVQMGDTPVQTTPEKNEERPVKSYDIQNVVTTWTKTPRGQTGEDGILWLPEVRFKVKNLSPHHINKHFRVLFIDQDNSISGHEIVETIGVLPPGYSRNNLLFRGTKGYTNETVFWKMLGDDSKYWKADIFIGDSYRGPWEKIKTVKISLPEPFKQLKKAMSSDTGKSRFRGNDTHGGKRGER